MLIMVKEFKISTDVQEVLHAAETLAVADVQKIFQSFAEGKVKKVQIGKMMIVNSFFSRLKGSKIVESEGHYVFFGWEKQKTSFLRTKTTHVLVWPLGTEVYVLPVESVYFEKPVKTAEEKMLIRKDEGEKFLFKTASFYNSKEHECFFKKMELYRKFAVEKDQMRCIKDGVVGYFRWTDPDPWVRENFTVEVKKDPMFFVRNEPGSMTHLISYPGRPALWGYEIDE